LNGRDLDIALHDDGVSEESTPEWTKAQSVVASSSSEVINMVTPMLVSSAPSGTAIRENLR